MPNHDAELSKLKIEIQQLKDELGRLQHTVSALAGNSNVLPILKNAAERAIAMSTENLLSRDPLLAMLCALVDSHPDKVALRLAFQGIWQSIGAPRRAVESMRSDHHGLTEVLAALSKAIGQELP